MTQGSLPPPTAEGTLETSPLAQVFAHAMDRRLSGSLQLDAPEGYVATVVFHEGWPCKARTSEPQFLGMVLHQLGLIDDTTMNASLARLAQERRPHGQILLAMGAITPDDLLRGLRVQLTAKLEPLFGLPGPTTFRFWENVDFLQGWGGPEVAPVDPLAILWPALVRSPPWPQVRGVLARLDAETPMRVSPRVDLARFKFSEGASNLVECMRATPLTLTQLRAARLAPEPETQLIVYLMLLTKQIVFSAPATGPKRAGAIPTPAQASPAGVGVTVPDPKRAPPPRMGSQPPPAHAAPEPPSRAAPSSGLPPSAHRSAPPPKIGSQPPPRASVMPGRPSAPPPGVALIPELAAFRQRIIERVATINDEDYFEVLGVPRGASISVVQAAFLALAKTWHPDRLAPQLFDVKDFSVKVFAKMNDARTTLTTPELREPYIAQLQRGVRADRAQVPEEIHAALEFQKAEVFLRRRAYDVAEGHCRRAREAEPANADYLALLTWIAVERGGPALPVETLQEHVEALTLALKLNERCERAYFYRGQLYKRMNRPEKAYHDFKEASEINPSNIDAARETHLYKRRGHT